MPEAAGAAAGGQGHRMHVVDKMHAAHACIPSCTSKAGASRRTCSTVRGRVDDRPGDDRRRLLCHVPGGQLFRVAATEKVGEGFRCMHAFRLSECGRWQPDTCVRLRRSGSLRTALS